MAKNKKEPTVIEEITEKEIREMIDIAQRQIDEHSETLRNCKKKLQELKNKRYANRKPKNSI